MAHHAAGFASSCSASIAIQALSDARSTTSARSAASCRAKKARAVSTVSPVTYGLGHDSP
jgi:hypothetical protein